MATEGFFSGPTCQNVTVVASTDVVAIQAVAPLYFVASPSRPKRSSMKYPIEARGPAEKSPVAPRSRLRRSGKARD